MTKRLAYLVLFVVALISLPALLTAQAPHGGAGTKLQPGPNVNAAGGIVNPGDPAALVKSDVLLQRQNETVVAASTRNPDHLMAAANDYRFVDFADDPQFGGGQSFIARLIARLLGRPTGKRLPPAAAAANVGPWTGVYRSCDRGRTWIGSALPGSPLDNSAAAQLPNPLKQLSLDAEALGGHAETTDPVLKAGPGGRMHMVVLGFVRFPIDNSVGASRMFYASYTDRNNVEGGSCFNFDFIRQIDTSTVYAGAGSPNPFIDKPSIAVDKDGMIVVSYTLFTDSVKSKIVIARSVDGGATWTKTMPILSLGFLRNHGTSTTIDPVNGTVYVAWRLFYQDWPLMVVSRSFDRGRTFLPATPISHWWPAMSLEQIIAQLKAARLRPFDQFNETPGGDPSKSTARSLAFPSIVAGAVNGQSRLYAVWQERAQINPTPAQGTPAFGLPYSNGSPRVMFTMSTDFGWSWTPRRAIDAGARVEHPLLPGFAEPPETRPSGPQVQPMLSISGLTNPQLLVLYYEARDELAPPFGSNFISGISRQMDVRAARINPVTGQLVAPSVQVAQYSVKANSSPVALAETAPGYDAVSRSNLWMYGGGTKAFFGDYPFIAPSVEFEFDTGSRWKWASEPASALTIWTDHRDVQFPANGIGGAWNLYTPVTSPLASCSHVALRNANPYFTEIAGVVAGSPQNFKPLNIQRSFVTYVENRTGQDRAFRLTLSGSPASFDQFANSQAVDVQVFANSSHTQTIWVAPNPARPTASVRMAVVEINTNGAVVAGGYRTSVTLNPDPNNDALTPIPSTAPVPPGTDTGINSSELHNPQVSAPQVSAFNIRAPQVSAPQVSAPQVSAPQVSAPQVSAPQVSAPQVSAPQVSAATPGDGNEGTDVTYTVTNVGNTESTYNALLNVPGVQGMLNGGYYDFQVLITRTSLVPGFVQTAGACLPAAENKVQVIANLQIPDASAAQFLAISGASSQLATFSVAPAGGADVAAFSTDGQSTIPRDEVKVTLRAIRLQPLASIPAEFVFDPAEVVLTVAAESTNVLNGVVQPDGTQPVVTATTTTLALATSPLGAVGDPVTLIATVSPAPPNAAQAMVQFFNGDTFLGAAPTDDGEASLTLESLPFAIRSFTARFTGTPTLAPSTSGVITQHVVQRLGDVEAFNATVAELSIVTENFDALPVGTPISQLNPIGGMLNFTSSFQTLETFSGAAGITAFGLNSGVRQNGRYDLFFVQPGAALAFDIAAQDPAASPVRIEVVTSAGSVFFTAVNPGVESANVFHGFIGTLPILGVRVHEGCEVGQPVVSGCLNEEIAIDNLRIAGRDVRLWSIDSGGNGHYYEYVRQGGLSWTEANAAAQARSYLGQPGRLVSITSAAENAFVDSLRNEGTLRAWIGLRDPDGIGAGSWAWTTGEPTSYFNWAALEPNNPSTEFWVEIFAGGAWNNNTVRDLAFPTLGYIVEYDPPAGPEIGFMIPAFGGSANGSQH